jgi:hypothetical protein
MATIGLKRFPSVFREDDGTAGDNGSKDGEMLESPFV